MYFDNNATTPLVPEVIEALTHGLQLFGNPSSIHAEGQKVKAELIQARREIASYLGVKPQEILFTSGGTEALNSLIFSFTKGKKGHLISSDLEHSAVMKPIDTIEGWTKTLIKGGLKGAVSKEDVEAAIQPDTALIALMAVNNETGVKTPWREIADLAEQKGIPFIIDGVALIGKEVIAPLPKGVTAMAFSGHKFHGPKGVGFFYLKAGTPFNPLILGGGQEAQKRGGTENFLGILGMKRAVELLKNDPPFQKLLELKNHFELNLQKEIPGILINGEGERCTNISNIAFDQVDGESLLFNLDLKGIQASHGSACSSGSLEPSRILLAMGYPLSRARSSIRFSFSRLNTVQEIDKLIAFLKVEVNSLRKKG